MGDGSACGMSIRLVIRDGLVIAVWLSRLVIDMHGLGQIQTELSIRRS